MPTLQQDGSYREDRWPGGIDNRSARGRVKDGCVADAVNVVPTHDGGFTLRPGYRQVHSGTNVRGALAVGEVVLLADGADLVEYNARSGASRVLRQIAEVGAFAGAVLNDELFFCTETETLRYKDGIVRRWGVPTAQEAQVTTTSGDAASQPGVYKIATTLVNEYGEESGVYRAQSVTVGEGRTLVVTPPATRTGYSTRVYVSAPNGDTMYLQAEAPAGPLVLATVRDDTQRMVTEGESEPEPGYLVVAVGATIAVASRSSVWLTNPMRPHSRRYAHRFFQYPRPVGVLQACGSGLFVSADKTYYVSNVDAEAAQRVVLNYPAISSTGVELPGVDSVAWMTPYGLAVGVEGGQVTLVSQDRFAPRVGDSGASGVIECDGTQAVVTTMRGQAGRNPLAARDYFEVEVV